MPNRSSVTRRTFVKSTAALAVAAPSIISARALGNEKTPSAGNRLTLGFIGIGKQASGQDNRNQEFAHTRYPSV